MTARAFYPPSTPAAIPGAAQSGSYFAAQQGPVGTAQATPVTGVLYLWPMFLASPTPVDRAAIEVTTVGTGVVRHGVYAHDPATGLPSGTGPLADYGTADVTSTGVKESTVSGVVLPAGYHWYGMAWQGTPTTPPTLRAMTASTTPGPINIGANLTHIAQGRLGYFASPVAGAFAAAAVTAANMHSLFAPRLAYRRV